MNLGLGLKYFREGAGQTAADFQTAIQNKQQMDLRNMQIIQAKREEALRVEEDRQTKAFDETVKNELNSQNTPITITRDKTPTLAPTWGQNLSGQATLGDSLNKISNVNQTSNRYETTPVEKPKRTQFEIMAEKAKEFPMVFKKFGMDYYNISKGEKEFQRKENLDAVNLIISLKKQYKDPQIVEDTFTKIYPDKREWVKGLAGINITKKGIQELYSGRAGNVDFKVMGEIDDNGNATNVHVVRGDEPKTPKDIQEGDKPVDTDTLKEWVTEFNRAGMPATAIEKKLKYGKTVTNSELKLLIDKYEKTIAKETTTIFDPAKPMESRATWTRPTVNQTTPQKTNNNEGATIRGLVDKWGRK